MRDATRVVRAGLPGFAQGEPFLPGPTFANPYHLAGDPSSSPYSYGRYHNPTWTHFEQALSELEGGTAVIFASGMAAVTAVLGSVLRPGNVLVMPSDGYYTARMLAEGYFAALGIEVRTAPTAGNARMEQHSSGWKHPVTLVWMYVILRSSLQLHTSTAHLWRWTIRLRPCLVNNPLLTVQTSLSPAIAKPSPVTLISCSAMWQQESLNGQNDCMPF